MNNSFLDPKHEQRPPDGRLNPTETLEILPIDISSFREGNTGTAYVHCFDSMRDGPVVMVNALTHGNELCGAYAVADLLERGLRPYRGRLITCFANIAAYHSFDADNPSQSRYIDEDFNRLWDPGALAQAKDSVERRRAREIFGFVEQADFLLDIHSMSGISAPLMLCGMHQKGIDLAEKVGVPADLVADPGHREGRRLRDFGDFGDAASDRTALLVECGPHWHRTSVDCALSVLYRFLQAVDVVRKDDLPKPLMGSRGQQNLIAVTEAYTCQSDRFYFVTPYQGLERIAKAGTIIGYDGVQPVVTPYDDCILVMPTHQVGRGKTAVRFGQSTALPAKG